MRTLRRFLSRIASSIREQDTRFDEEIESHIVLMVDENIRARMEPEEARRQALLKFGSVRAFKEDCRAEQGLPFAE